MKNLLKSGFLITLLVCAHASFADTKSITYKNQRGSVITLNWDEGHSAGNLTGTFTTAVSKCNAVIGKAIPIAGVYNNNTVALTANYPECGSVVAMSGNLNKDKTEMHLHWFVTRQAEDSLFGNWDTTITGADQYKKQ